MEDKLKPCPFCGNTEIRVEPRYSEISGEIYFYKVTCFMGCYATVGNHDKHKAISKWNNRV